MRLWKRVVLRVLFCLIAGVLLYGMITMPCIYGPSLRLRETLAQTGVTTPRVHSAGRDMPSAAMTSLAEPPAEAEEIPPVAGDILGLMYHDLTENEAWTSAWTTMPDKFRTDMTALLDAGYVPLSLEDYVAGNVRAGQDYFVLTFDDGYTSNLTMALPILAELGIPATVFVITGNTTLNGHMTWDELREITASGIVSVYSHTETHLKANETTTADFLNNEHTAWAQIEENLTPAMKAMAYPHGAYTRESMAALAAEGYKVFAIQDVPWWYTEGNDAGIRILMRHNVAYESDILRIAASNRARLGLPTVEAATEIRAQYAAAKEEARLAQYRAWIAYEKASLEASRAKMEKTK